MYNVLITDLDGTAIKKGAQEENVNLRITKLISLAGSNRKIITCATGRNWKLAKPIIHKLGIIYPCIIGGGSIIIDPITEKILWEKRIKSNDANYLYTIFKNVKSEEDLQISYSDKGRYKIKEINGLNIKEPNYVYLIGCNTNLAYDLMDKINNSNRDIVAHSTPSWERNDLVDIHVTHINGTKKHAVGALLDILKVKKSTVIGIGDSDNDIPLHESVGLKICTLNATHSLIVGADYIAPGEAEDALIYSINKFLFNNNDSRIKISAGGLVYHNEKFLLIRDNTNGEIVFPKGTVEQSEALQNTVVREVLEETGYHIVVKNYIGNSEYEFTKDGLSFRKFVFYYLLELIDPKENPKPTFQNDEDFQNLWMNYENAYNVLTHIEDRFILHKAFKLINSTIL